MPRQISNSLFNSLRGRIWISTSVLAFFICTFGLLAYLVVSMLVADVFYGIFIPFLFLAFVVVGFGWWLSNEIVGPVERVTLISKSLERTSSTSIPKSSGSFETDELLQTLFRNSQQVQQIVTMMDGVANGNLDVSLAPIEGYDRLNASFGKLLARVAESIHAREELDALQASLEKLKREAAPVRSGNLAGRLTQDDPQTREIAAAFNYLLDNLSGVIELARANSRDAGDLSKAIENNLRTLILQDESRIDEMTQASIAIKQVPNMVQNISENLENASQSAKMSMEKVRKGNEVAAKNADAVSKTRRQLREVSKRVQSLTERSQDISKLATLVDDLSNRTNMVALNASIQATEMGEQGKGFALVAEEVERLAGRATSTNKQIAALSKSLGTEIRKVENALELAGGEISAFSRFAIECSNLLAELERHVGQFVNLHENLLNVSGDRSVETDRAFLTFLNSISESKATVDELKNSSKELSDLFSLMDGLQVAVSDYRLALPEPEPAPETPEEESDDMPSMEEEAVYLSPPDEPELPDAPAPHVFDPLANAEPAVLKTEPVEPGADAEGLEIAEYYETAEILEEDLAGVGDSSR